MAIHAIYFFMKQQYIANLVMRQAVRTRGLWWTQMQKANVDDRNFKKKDKYELNPEHGGKKQEKWPKEALILQRRTSLCVRCLMRRSSVCSWGLTFSEWTRKYTFKYNPIQPMGQCLSSARFDSWPPRSICWNILDKQFVEQQKLKKRCCTKG